MLHYCNTERMFKNKLVLVIVILILVAAAVLVLKYSGLYGTGGMKSGTPSNLTVPANTVLIQSNSFNPSTLTVKVGQKVTWTNNDSYTHTVTSDDGTFTGGDLPSGQSFSFTFTKPGTYAYHCSIHTFMTGTVVVTQ